MTLRLLSHLRRERGMALPIALATLTVLAITATTVLFFSSANSRNADRDKRGQLAFALAEAGLNNVLGVLNNPTNNALKQNILPACTGAESTWNTSSYEGGTVRWCGTLIVGESAWSVTAKGIVSNASNGNLDVTRTIGAYVPVTPVVNQQNNNPAWNYIMSTATGSECDQTIYQSLTIESAMFVHGSLCLENNANLRIGPVIVKGTIKLDQNGTIGQSSNRIEVSAGGINRDGDANLELCVQGGTQWSNSTAEACDDSDNIFSKLTDGTAGVNTSPITIAKPTADWDTWYQDAMPGPLMPCNSTNGASSGTVPTFDNDTVRNTSVSSVFELTPASSYTCRVGPVSNPIGQLSWDASTKVLTVAGVVFIDGSVAASNGSLNTYNGQGTIYMSGTFLMANNTKLCGSTSGGDCNYSGWNPNTELLSVIANGNGGQVPTGYSVRLSNGAKLQGAVFANLGVYLDQNASTDGPLLGSTILISQNYTGDDFGTIQTAPPGLPGNPEVYAQPNPPQRFSS
jgi:Tfp pilus assembly protein PilX